MTANEVIKIADNINDNTTPYWIIFFLWIAILTFSIIVKFQKNKKKAYPMDIELEGGNLVTLIFKGKEGIRTYTGSYKIKFTSSGEKPYVMNQDLKTIGEGYSDVSVYVPIDFNF